VANHTNVERWQGAGGSAGTEFRVCASSELDDGALLAEVAGRPVGVFRFRGRLYAFENRCVHQGGPVCLGEVIGRVVLPLAADGTAGRECLSEEEFHLICPWHGWAYDIETGECVGDRSLGLTRLRAVERDGDVFVVIEGPSGER
jgi:nitrite reductase (NADH) small subunit